MVLLLFLVGLPGRTQNRLQNNMLNRRLNRAQSRMLNHRLRLMHPQEEHIYTQSLEHWLQVRGHTLS